MADGNLKILNGLVKKAKKTKAYQCFLRDNSIGFKNFNNLSLKDFKKLPIADKKNYINKYPLNFFSVHGKMHPMMHLSSGSSGRQTFWFIGDEQEEIGAKFHEMIFKEIFEIKKDEPTLVIDCFAMGVWVAGTYTLNTCRRVSKNGYSLSTITPGIEKENIINILKNITPYFKNLIIVGYPPFIMDVLMEASKQKIKLTNKIKVLTAAENFEEDWRKKVLKLLGIKDYYNSLINIYGSADTAALGHETPLTIFLRKQALLNKNLYHDLFGDEYFLPSLVQYYPDNVFIEEINGEIIITASTAMPLIRYNIHDKGRIIEYEKIKDIIIKYGLYEKAIKYGLNKWRFPFIIINGRTDVSATIYGLNIYPENIRSGVEDKRISKLLSGNFLVYKKILNKTKNPKLCIKIELADNSKISKNTLKLIKKIIIENLIKLNAEFRKIHSSIGNKVLPVIYLSPNGDKIFKSQNIKGLIQIKGRKPKLIV